MDPRPSTRIARSRRSSATRSRAWAFPRRRCRSLPFTDRDAVRALVQQAELVDLAIPRGGEALIRFVTENARVPVVQHYKGVCHLYLDRGADAELAQKIVLNAKMSRPGVCNALECLLVDSARCCAGLAAFGPGVGLGGLRAPGVRANPRARSGGEAGERPTIGGVSSSTRSSRSASSTGIDGALAHVADYGSGHTEAILTQDAGRAERWRREVDAACVVVNASTRSTTAASSAWARRSGSPRAACIGGADGPESLTTMKWVLDGNGQMRMKTGLTRPRPSVDDPAT